MTKSFKFVYYNNWKILSDKNQIKRSKLCQQTI